MIRLRCLYIIFRSNRLLWEEWEDFITGGRLGVGVEPVTAPIPPYFDIEAIEAVFPEAWQDSSLFDYLGGPNFGAVDPNFANWAGARVDAMPLLAYQLCYMEYYRDRNWTADDFQGMDMPVASGLNNNPAYLAIRFRNYMHDYFTSALPFTQRGEQVLIPVDAAVTYLDASRVFMQMVLFR